MAAVQVQVLYMYLHVCVFMCVRAWKRDNVQRISFGVIPSREALIVHAKKKSTGHMITRFFSYNFRDFHLYLHVRACAHARVPACMHAYAIAYIFELIRARIGVPEVRARSTRKHGYMHT
jgi:hypothetical protein